MKCVECKTEDASISVSRNQRASPGPFRFNDLRPSNQAGQYHPDEWMVITKHYCEPCYESTHGKGKKRREAEKIKPSSARSNGMPDEGLNPSSGH